MATRTIPEPGIKQYFQRTRTAPVRQPNALEFMLLAPWYHVARAIADSEPVESSRLTFTGIDGGNATTGYNAGYWRDRTYNAVAPGMPTGSTLDEDWSSLFLISGTGSTRTVLELPPASEEVTVVNRSTTTDVVITDSDTYGDLGVLGGPVAQLGAGKRAVTFPGVNFALVLAGYSLPGIAADTRPDYFSTDDDLLVVRFNDHPGRPARVYGYLPASPDTLIVDSDPWVPAAGPVGAVLVAYPKVYTVSAAAVAARLPMQDTYAGVATAGVAADTSAGIGGTALYSLDETVNWTVTFTHAVGPTTAAITVLAANAGTIAVTANFVAGVTVDSVNAAIAAELRSVQKCGRTLVFFYGHASVDEFDTDANRFTGAATSGALGLAGAPTWTGAIESKVAGAAGNGYSVGIVLHASSATPVVERIGSSAWLISLGTIAANNTIAAINTGLELAGDVLTITLDTGATTDLVDRWSLGRTHTHGAGYTDVDYSPTNQNLYLQDGKAAGTFSVYGGLIANYDTTYTTAVSIPVYAEYRALRVDKSAAASPEATGSRASLTEVRYDTFEGIVGEVSVDNPMGLACHEFFAAAQNRRAYLLSPSAVNLANTGEEWGTRDAVNEALAFVLRRNVYHLGILNGAPWMPALASQFARSLGGTETEPLRASLYVYHHYGLPTFAPDISVTGGSEATDIGGGDLMLDVNIAALSLDSGYLTAGRYILSFTSEANNTAGDETLQSGDLGYVISAVNVGGNPYRITLAGGAPTGTGSWQIFLAGETLVDPVTGLYDTAGAITALGEYLPPLGHRRVERVFCSGYEPQVFGVNLVVDPVYSVAKYLGVVASAPDTMPSSQRQLPLTNRIRGTNDTFIDDQLDTLAGYGLTILAQVADSDSAIPYVRRDVTSDTTTATSQRRGATVVEDMLARALDALIKPLMGPNLVTPELLDVTAGRVGTLIDNFKQHFKVLDLLTIEPVTDEIRAQYDIDDTGVRVILEYSHLEEAGTTIMQHIVRE